MPAEFRFLLRLGSWSLAVRSARACDGALLSFLYKGNVVADDRPGLEFLQIERVNVLSSGTLWELRREPNQWRLLLSRQATRCAHVLMTSMDFALHRLLFACDVLVLHASGVRLDSGAVWLFLGPRGSGKTTLALALARSGGEVLADDRIVLRAGQVSGCGSTAKLTAASENYLFPDGLQGPAPRNFQGLIKREIPIVARPYEDFPPQRLFFPTVRSQFHREELPRSQALLALLDQSRDVLRYADAAETRRISQSLTRLVQDTRSFRLQLGPDLRGLDGLRLRLEGDDS